MESLRDTLEALTKIQTKSGQIDRMKQVNREFGCAITPLEFDGPNDFNCFLYALGLSDCQEIKDALFDKQRTDIKAGAEYIGELLDAEVLLPSKDGQIVMYLAGSTPSHAARLKQRDRCASKWGLGLLWEHGLYELPTTYGDKHNLFMLTSRREAIKVFLKYAEKF